MELIFMIKLLWNTIGEPEHDPREKKWPSQEAYTTRVFIIHQWKQNSSFSDTDVKKEKEYRQKSSLCLSTVSSEEKDYRLQSEYKKTTAENICWVSYIS